MPNNDRDYNDLRTQLERAISEAGSLRDIAHKAKDLKGELAYDSIIKSNTETLQHLDNGNFMPYPNQNWGVTAEALGVIADQFLSSSWSPTLAHQVDPNNGFL